jgi:hypothetical protein
VAIRVDPSLRHLLEGARHPSVETDRPGTRRVAVPRWQPASRRCECWWCVPAARGRPVR